MISDLNWLHNRHVDSDPENMGWYEDNYRAVARMWPDVREAMLA